MTFAHAGRRIAVVLGLFGAFVASSLLAARRNDKVMTTDTRNSNTAKATAPTQMKSSVATPEDAREFVEGAERRLLTLWVASQRASWVQETFITPDTEGMGAGEARAVKG